MPTHVSTGPSLCRRVGRESEGVPQAAPCAVLERGQNICY